MRELTFEENKKYQVEILKDIARFCDKNNLTYFLAYGTLIGAVRHKGFIPWDDDIDLQMPRPDYNKFLETYKSEYFKVINPYNKQAKHSMGKVIDTRTIKLEKAVKYNKGEELGIDIDIFPLDGQPDDDKTFLKYYEKKQKIYKLFYFTISDFKQFSFKAKIAYFIPLIVAKLIGKNHLLDMINKIDMNYPYEKSNYIGSTASLYNSQNNRFPREWYQDTVMLKFEDCEFKAPISYHNVLTKMYGDYMILPPKEQQATHHKNKVFFKD